MADIRSMDLGLFLCRDDAERRRMADIARNLRPGTPFLLGFFMLAGLSGVGTYGWLPLIPPGAALVAYLVVWTFNIGRRHRPEVMWFAVLVFAEVMLAISQLMGHGPRGFSLVIMTMPPLLAGLIFPRRVVIAVTALAAALIVLILVAVDMAEIRHTPSVAYEQLFVLVSLVVTALVVRDLDVASRRSALVDELTGTLNRSALTPKLAEITQQARVTGEPIAVVITDIDHFKKINDEYGHPKGDAVLREIAQRLSDCVSAFEPVYRLGGEEFVVLLPGLSAQAANEVAQRMWQSVRDRPIQGMDVTMSFGVSSSPIQHSFDFDMAFARADHALYAAKRSGRDRVMVAEDVARPAAALEGRRLLGPDATDRRAGARRRSAAAASGRRLGRAVAADDDAQPSSSSTLGVPVDTSGAPTVTEELEREYIIDLNRRLGGLFRVIAVGAFVAILTAAPEFGWYPLVPPVAGAVPYYLLARHAYRFRRPDLVVLAGWVVFQTSIAGGFMLSQHAPLFALSLLVLMVPGRCAVLRTRAAAFGTVYTAVLMIGVAFALDAHRVLADPAVVMFPLALLFEAGYAGAVVGGSAVGFRGAGVIDGLTGLLNRAALNSRLVELDAQAATVPRTVAIVMGDLDHFKQINDTSGHTTGDAVLRDVAQRISRSLRAFEPAYRVGGEEFLVLLPDADADAAMRVAERLRQVVRAEPCGGVSVTMSFGAAASVPGLRFDYDEVFDRADVALYEAKRTGRDRVCVDLPDSTEPPIAAMSTAA
jgi:diguanylate cyclase (GGDEF)-like protein